MYSNKRRSPNSKPYLIFQTLATGNLISRLLTVANIPFSVNSLKIVTNVSATSLLTKLIKISLPYQHKTFSTFEGL